MPYKGEHSCRVREPGRFQNDSFRRKESNADGKKLILIVGKLKGESSTTLQAYRYPTSDWSESAARKHCKGHKGIKFEPAKKEEDSDMIENENMALFPDSQYWAIEPLAFRQFLNRTRGPLSLEQIKAITTEAAIGKPGYQTYNKVAVLRIRGIMEKLPTVIGNVFGDTATVNIRRSVKAALQDRSVENILLVIDSPGGTVDGIHELGDALYQARQIKPITAQVDGLGASAAYWTAAQANQIFLGRGDQVGSIGVRMALYDYHKMFENEGVEAVVIDTGVHKSAGLQGTEITEEQRKEFQRITDTYYENFLDAIQRGRGMSRETVKPLADGRVFVGQEAVDLGLADAVQTFEETLMQISRKPGVSRESVRRQVELIRMGGCPESSLS